MYYSIIYLSYYLLYLFIAFNFKIQHQLLLIISTKDVFNRVI